LMHRLAGNDAGRFHVHTAAFDRFDRAFAVDRVAERIDNATKQTLANRHVHDGAGTFNRIAFFNVAVVTENNDTDIVAFEVQRHAAHATGELDHFARLDVVEAVNTGDTVT